MGSLDHSSGTPAVRTALTSGRFREGETRMEFGRRWIATAMCLVTMLGSCAASARAAVEAVSATSAEYARDIGGTDHSGESLFFLIGASVRTEDQARKVLERALPFFGDMQSYFIVQRSDSFQGLKPGWRIVMEAYRNTPSKENLELARRAFPDAYVRRATVLVSEPIPVYEDLVER